MPERISAGATSTTQSKPIGARPYQTSACCLPANSPIVMNITAPRITSANTLISVWDTIVPSTAGNRSRARPRRRATTSARDGSPSRAGSVADISTPIVVPWTASTIRGLASGSAALRIACQETARRSIEAHISASPSSTHGGLERTSASPIRDSPMCWTASTEATMAARPAAPTSPRRISLPRPRALGSSDGSRRAGTRGSPSAGTTPTFTAARRVAVSGSGTASASSYAVTTCSATRGQA